MTFSIAQTFDLLFTAARPAPGRPGFEQRRWFRRPAPVSAGDGNQAPNDVSTSDDVTMAQDQLVLKVKSSIPPWAAACGASAPISFDPLRHLPPRSPYDVFAAAAHLVEQAGVYHHIQPCKAAKPADGSAETPVPGSPICRSPRPIVTRFRP